MYTRCRITMFFKSVMRIHTTSSQASLRLRRLFMLRKKVTVWLVRLLLLIREKSRYVVTNSASLYAIFSKLHKWLASLFLLLPINNFVVYGAPGWLFGRVSRPHIRLRLLPTFCEFFARLRGSRRGGDAAPYGVCAKLLI